MLGVGARARSCSRARARVRDSRRSRGACQVAKQTAEWTRARAHGPCQRASRRRVRQRSLHNLAHVERVWWGTVSGRKAKVQSATSDCLIPPRARVHKDLTCGDAMPCSSELLLSPLLLQPAMADTVAGAADYRGQPASRAATGGWKSSVFVMGTSRSLVLNSLCTARVIDTRAACIVLC